MTLACRTRAAELLIGGHQVGAAVRGVVVAVLVCHGVHGPLVLAHGVGGCSWRGERLSSLCGGVWRSVASGGAEERSEEMGGVRALWTGGDVRGVAKIMPCLKVDSLASGVGGPVHFTSSSCANGQT